MGKLSGLLPCEPSINSSSRKEKKLCRNRSLLKDLRLYKRPKLARIGGAPAAGRRVSRFATVHTKGLVSRQNRRTLPKPKRSPGAAANIPGMRRSATARTAVWVKRNYWRFFPPGSFSFLRKKYWVSATLSIERSRFSSGARFLAILSWRAMRLTAVVA